MNSFLKRLNNSPSILLAMRLALGGIFVAASLGKISDHSAFFNLITAYKVIPESVAQPLVVILPLIELVAGVMLISGFLTWFASYLSMVLAASFIVANSCSLALGADGSCGCFGQAVPLSHTQSLLLDGTMLLTSLVLALCHRNSGRILPHLSRGTAFSVTLAIFLVLGSLPPQSVLASARGEDTDVSTRQTAAPVDRATIPAAQLIADQVDRGVRDSIKAEESLANTHESTVIPLVQKINGSLGEGKPAFLFFYADWCHFCQNEKPIIDTLEQQYSRQITFLRFNNERDASALKEYGVSGFPTMYLVTGKKENGGFIQQKFGGFTNETVLRAGFDRVISGDTFQDTVSATVAPPLAVNSPGQPVDSCFDYSTPSECNEGGCSWCEAYGVCLNSINESMCSCASSSSATECNVKPNCQYCSALNVCRNTYESCLCGNHVVDPGEECDGSPNCTSACTCSDGYQSDNGVCVKIAYTLLVSKSGSGAGIVTSNPAGIDCGVTCSASLAPTWYTLTAVPVAGAVFTRWSGAGCSGNGTCAIALSSPTSVTATFTDVTPPAAVPTQNPLANSAGWNNGDVSVTWNWTDTGGSLIDDPNCSTTSASSGEGPVTLNASCKDRAGNTGNASYTLKVDKTPPMVTPPPDKIAVATGALTPVDIGTATALDTVSGAGTVTNNAPSAGFPVGTTIVTWKAKDAAGNEGTAKQSVTVIETNAVVNIAPETLNLKSQSDKSAVTAYIELPTGYDVNNVDVRTVKLNVQGTSINAQLAPTSVGDFDNDGVPDRMVKFDRLAITSALAGKTGNVSLTLIGMLNDSRVFTGTTTIKVLSPGK